MWPPAACGPFDVWDDLGAKPDAREPPALAQLANVDFRPSLQEVAGLPPGLHAGERAAISIAVALPGATVLLDEQAARKAARRLGLRVVGTLGVLVEAKRRGLLRELGPVIAAMQSQGRHLSTDLVRAVLTAAGEPPIA